jgi:hypothetical protein
MRRVYIEKVGKVEILRTQPPPALPLSLSSFITAEYGGVFANGGIKILLSG